MGQYHIPVNIDKREYLHPHCFNDGLKQLEWGCGGLTGTALACFLSCSHDRGGGDLRPSGPLEDYVRARGLGRWAGDRIVVVGDYSEWDDPGLGSLHDLRDFETDASPWDVVLNRFQDASAIGAVVLYCDGNLANDLGEGDVLRCPFGPTGELHTPLAARDDYRAAADYCAADIAAWRAPQAAS